MNEDIENQRPVNRLDLLFLIGAYNRGEITFEEWLKQTKAWAEKTIEQQDGAEVNRPMRAAKPSKADTN